MDLETFKKLPLGGVDRRALVGALAEHGADAAASLLRESLSATKPAGTRIGADDVVLILGGSNGITRALAIELAFAERASVFCVHFDSEKMQIGHHHAHAMEAAATKAGRTMRFWNADAMKPQTIEDVVAAMKPRFRAAHLINGIAAGATKRYAEHGATKVKDLDVAFDAVLQVPDFSTADHVRRVGLVDVEVATEADIERTNKYMGTSSLVWGEALAAAGLLAKEESIVAFCDYDYPPDDPVYAMGPLAGAKRLQRESMTQLRDRYGVKAARICYPAMATTALGAIPGGLLMYALTAQILRERGEYQTLMELAVASMELFRPSWDGGDLLLDRAYQATLPEFHARKDKLSPSDLRDAFRLIYGIKPGL
jgi:enoyl-[acyl-carrier protein] reductase/trans-2-enoyl-CoA reductase (NAD+)